MKVLILVAVVTIGLSEGTLSQRRRVKSVYPNPPIYGQVRNAYSLEPAYSKPVYHAPSTYTTQPVHSNPYPTTPYQKRPVYSAYPKSVYPIKPVYPLKPVYRLPHYQGPAPLEPFDFSQIESSPLGPYHTAVNNPIAPVQPPQVGYKVASSTKPVYGSQLEEYHKEKYHSGKPYNFVWNVKSNPFANDFGHQESSDGRDVTGSYHVRLPDGRKQIVHYKANDFTGFVADVKYEDVSQVDAVQPTPAPVLTETVADTAVVAAPVKSSTAPAVLVAPTSAPEAVESAPDLVEPSAAPVFKESAAIAEIAEPSSAPEPVESAPEPVETAAEPEEPSSAPEPVESAPEPEVPSAAPELTETEVAVLFIEPAAASEMAPEFPEASTPGSFDEATNAFI